MYKIFIKESAQKALDKISSNDADKIIKSIQNLAINPRPVGYKKLVNTEAYRIRKGDYRIIYEIFDDILVIDIIAIGHRKDIYKYLN
jgi:mRNA interferase RelE/StbE